jgi:hypothetical protein
MSEQQPPYAAPPGYVWTKSWFGLGSWVLIEDQQFPLPPPGFRYQTHFWTGRPELVPVMGQGVVFLDPNSQPRPNYGPPSRNYSFGTPDPTRVGPGIQFTGRYGQDPPPDGSARPGKNRYNSENNAAAIF